MRCIQYERALQSEALLNLDQQLIEGHFQWPQFGVLQTQAQRRYVGRIARGNSVRQRPQWRLYATKTPHGTLDILSVTADGLAIEQSVPVGMETVAVALFGNGHDNQQAEQQRQLSIAQPLGMAVSADGTWLYVASFGTDKLAVCDTTELEDASVDITAAAQISLAAGGPTAVVLDETRNRLYATTRYNNGLSIVDTVSNAEVGAVKLFNPEPRHIVESRPHLYNASTHSSHGDASCASYHIFGDLDDLARDLGNPDKAVVANPNRFVSLVLSPGEPARFHPMKGPMTTQSLRGLADHGPMHWTTHWMRPRPRGAVSI